MFENFHHEETAEIKQLENGQYLVKITKAENKYYNNGNGYCEITVAIKDYPGYVPNKIILNDIPAIGAPKGNGYSVTADDVKRANQAVTRFCQAFKIDERTLQNIDSFVGHAGTVNCNWQYDANEPDKKSKKYKALFPQVIKNESIPSVPQQKAPSNSFSEDIPW